MLHAAVSYAINIRFPKKLNIQHFSLSHFTLKFAVSILFSEFVHLKKQINESIDRIRNLILKEYNKFIDTLYTQLKLAVPQELSFLLDLSYVPGINANGELVNRFNSNNPHLYPKHINFELSEIIWPLRIELGEIQRRIITINSHTEVTTVRNNIFSFQEKCSIAITRITDLKLKAKNETLKKVQNATDIQIIINNLKLNLNNPEHVHYWQSKVKFCGGNNPLRVPDRIYRMMKIASQEQTDKNIFIYQLNQIRNAPNQYSWADYWIFKNLRDKATRELYESKDISKHILNA